MVSPSLCGLPSHMQISHVSDPTISQLNISAGKHTLSLQACTVTTYQEVPGLKALTSFVNVNMLWTEPSIKQAFCLKMFNSHSSLYCSLISPRLSPPQCLKMCKLLHLTKYGLFRWKLFLYSLANSCCLQHALRSCY